MNPQETAATVTKLIQAVTNSVPFTPETPLEQKMVEDYGNHLEYMPKETYEETIYDLLNSMDC